MSRRGIHPLLMGLDRPARNDRTKTKRRNSAAMSQPSANVFCAVKMKI